MRHRQEPGLHRSQQSIFYYSDLEGRRDPVLRARPDYFVLLYPHMLIEDVALGIMPIGGRVEKKPFRVFVTPQNPRIEELIAEAIARRDYRRDFTSAVCDFFHDCAQTIMAFEEATYEIVYLSKPDEGAVVGFELMLIPQQTVIRRRGDIVQYIPADVAHKRKVSQYVQLSPERILTFKPPEYVQDKLGHIMESLAILSNPILPDFALQGAGGGLQQVPYDSTTHIRVQKRALADAGKLIGWNARGLFQEEVLEYYWLYRQLLFEKFKIELRNSILATLNNGLDRAGRELGFSGRIEIEGLPILADIDAAQVHLAAGDRPFKEILEPFLEL